MKSTSVVFEHQFDEELLDQIESMRSVRLNLAVKMLSDLPKTINDLKTRGVTLGHEPTIDEDELRMELEDKIEMLRSRIDTPDVIYADEISFYVDLIEADDKFNNVEIY